MPTNRKRVSRKRKAPISACEWAFLNDDLKAEELDDSDGWDVHFLNSSLQDGKPFFEIDVPKLWRENRDEILRDWIQTKPGTRPSCWWRFDAPRATQADIPRLCWWQIKDGRIEAPRQRLGGIGTPSFEVLAYLVTLSHGLPNHWVSDSNVERYGADFAAKAQAIDSDDPPKFESEAAYLDRLGLFLAGERAALTDEDFEPKTITFAESEG